MTTAPDIDALQVLSVEQADREAASRILISRAAEQRALDGYSDANPIIQAFARHRQAAYAAGAADLATTKAAIAWANSSLFGSHGFFLSMDGGLPDEHHLDREIEKLKELSNKRWREAEALKAALADARKALEPFAKAGSLFDNEPEDPRYHVVIYNPAAGDDYKITDRHLRLARAHLHGGGE